MYKVQVNKPETMPDGLTTDGYLKFRDDTPWLYSRGEAIKKANMFGGKIKVVENLVSSENSSIMIISGGQLLYWLRQLLKNRELFGSTDVNSINSFIYEGSIFANMRQELEDLEKNGDFKMKDDIRNQLNELSQIITSEYVLINDMCFS